MNKLDEHNLKVGSRVKMKYYDRWATGEVTIINADKAKVLFDGDFDLDYWYYPIEELEFESDENRDNP